MSSWGDVAAWRNDQDISEYRNDGDVQRSIHDRAAKDQLTEEEQERLDREREAMESWYGEDGDRWGGEAESIDQQHQEIRNQGNPAWGRPGNGYDPNAPIPRGSNRRVDKIAKTKTKAKRKWHKTPLYQNGDQLRQIYKSAKRTKKKAKTKSFWF